jgi:hypothetical protein
MKHSIEHGVTDFTVTKNVTIMKRAKRCMGYLTRTKMASRDIMKR